MKILLKSLSILNFKGISALDIDFSDSTVIRGKNGSGKTSVYDAFLWLLFGKNSEDATAFGVIRNGQTEASVSCILDVEGSELKLSRTIKQVWQKKRGQAEAELTGTETVYSVDDVPCLKKDFEAKINLLADPEIFRIMSNPRYFNSLKWEKKREILLNSFGMVDENAVLASFPKLLNALNGKKASDLKAVKAKARKEINETLKTLPARIDEVNQIFTAENQELPDKSSEIEAIRSKITEIDNGLANVSAKSDIMRLNAEISKVEAEIMAVKIQNESGEAKYRGEFFFKKQQKESEISMLDEKIQMVSEAIRLAELKKPSLNDRYGAVLAAQFTADVCSACGQTLPVSRIQEMERLFEQDRTRKTVEIKEEAEKIKEEIQGLEAKLSDLITRKENSEKELAEMKPVAFVLVSDEQLKIQKKELQVKISELQKTIDDSKSADAERHDLANRIQVLLEEQKKFDRFVAKNKQKAESKARIDELKQEERDLSLKLIEIDQILLDIDNFQTKICEQAEEQINSHFQSIRWKLFEMQMNGIPKDVCIATVDGVDYLDLNNARKIQSGIETINALSEVYGLSVPIFIDNRESVTDLPECDQQIISLVVDPSCEKLTISGNADYVRFAENRKDRSGLEKLQDLLIFQNKNKEN